MAVSISSALLHSCLSSLSSISPLRLLPSLHSHKPVLVLQNPRSQSPAAFMSVEAPRKSPDASFLDRKESGLLHFVKYQGLGNDFIMVDNRDSLEPRVIPEQAVNLCNRNFGIGADGVIFAMAGVNGTDYSVRIFNSDCSEPEVIHCLKNLYLFHTFPLMAVDKRFKQLEDVLMVRQVEFYGKIQTL